MSHGESTVCVCVLFREITLQAKRGLIMCIVVLSNMSLCEFFLVISFLGDQLCTYPVLQTHKLYGNMKPVSAEISVFCFFILQMGIFMSFGNLRVSRICYFLLVVVVPVAVEEEAEGGGG